MTVAGPVFLAILGMSLYLSVGLLGKKVVAPRVALSVPYVWTIGVFTFSAGLFYGGLKGVPRRTNLGMSYLDQLSDVYRPDWRIGEYIGAVGGSIMGLAVLLFFYVLVRSLASTRSEQQADAFALPESEAYHNEDVGVVRNFRPWIVAAVIAILISYIPPLVQVLSANYPLVSE